MLSPLRHSVLGTFTFSLEESLHGANDTSGISGADCIREERGGVGMDGHASAASVDGSTGSPERPTSSGRPKLKLAPRSKPVGDSGPARDSKKSSIFGEGKAHDEFAYEVNLE